MTTDGTNGPIAIREPHRHVKPKNVQAVSSPVPLGNVRDQNHNQAWVTFTLVPMFTRLD